MGTRKRAEKFFRIMEDRGAWQFTPEQIIAIKNKNPEAAAKFYTDNFKIFSGMAHKFAYNAQYIYGNYLYDYDDLIQQVYIDLPYCDYSSRSALWYGIVKGSFLRVNIGGITTEQSKFIKRSVIVHYEGMTEESDNPYYALDKAAHTADAFEVMIQDEEREKADSAIIEFLKLTITNPKDFNKMFCQLFTDIPLNQIKGNEYECYAKC